MSAFRPLAKAKEFRFWVGAVAASVVVLGWQPKLAAQPIDPSIGRNIPGAVAVPAPVPGFDEDSAAEEDPELPEVGSYGIPSEGTLQKLTFTGALKPEDRKGGMELAPGVFGDRVDLLESDRRFAEIVSTRYVGQPLTDENLQALVEEGLKFYFDADRPLVVIQPTAIDFETGEVEVAVIEALLDRKRVEGARWFSKSWLQGGLRVQSGNSINRRNLLNDVHWLNRNPALQAQVEMSPGSRPGTTDVILEVKDRFPLRGSVEVDNTGSGQTGPWRWGLGVNWFDVLRIGHQLNLQFSAPFERITSQPVFAGSYIAPLPWRHLLAIYGSYSSTDVDYDFGAAGTYNYQGYQAQLTPRYTIPIGPLFGDFTHELTFGVDWKSTDLSFVQGGDVIPSNKTTVVQFMTGYDAALVDAWGVTSLAIDLYWSPGGIGDLNTTEAYEQVDPRLQADYFFGYIQVERTTRLPADLRLITRAGGQFASAPLPSSEQLSIGGWGTVRGYEAYVLLGDQGFVSTVELQSPSVAVARHILSRAPSDDLRFVAFWDLGLVNVIEPLPGDETTTVLTSVGAGLRYRLGDHVSVRCDVGFPLIDPDLGFEVDVVGLNFGAVVAF